MSRHKVKVLRIEKIAQNIYKLLTEKPKEFSYVPGQFTEVSLNNDSNKKNYQRHFSFTGLRNADHLEFIIKPCKNNDAIAKKIVSLRTNDKLIISNPKGSLHYKRMGTFIAGGTGITPFISIFRDLKQKNDLAGNKLIYSNKTINDVILHDELSEMLGMNYTNLFTKERFGKYYFGRIDKNFLRMEVVDFVQDFYVSGSTEFVNDVNSILKYYGVKADSIIVNE